VEPAQATSDPIDSLLGPWRTYVEFGHAHPTRYRVIFERRFVALWDDEPRPMVETLPRCTGTAKTKIGLLQTCIDSGCSVGSDALADSVAIGRFVHGIVACPPPFLRFPGPTSHSLEVRIANLVHLRRPGMAHR
jgi:hypothetical protein